MIDLLLQAIRDTPSLLIMLAASIAILAAGLTLPRWQRRRAAPLTLRETPDPRQHLVELVFAVLLLAACAVLTINIVAFLTVRDEPDVYFPPSRWPILIGIIALFTTARWLNRTRPALARAILLAVVAASPFTLDLEYVFGPGSILLAGPAVVAGLVLEIQHMLIFLGTTSAAYTTTAYLLVALTGETYHADWFMLVAFISIGCLAVAASSQMSRAIQIERRNRQIQDRALHTLSHELRTPLVVLRGFWSFARQAGVDFGRAAALAPSAQAQTDYLHTLAEHIVTFASVQMPDAQFEPVDLAAIAGQVQEQMAGLAAEAGLELITTAQPATVLGSAHELRILLVNLVSNTIKHSHGRRAEVQVVPASGAAGPALRVADDGVGLSLPPGLLARPWVHNGPDVRGIGLGLAIVAEIVRRHRAELEMGPGPDGRGLGVAIQFPHEHEPAQQRLCDRLDDLALNLVALVVAPLARLAWRRRRHDPMGPEFIRQAEAQLERDWRARHPGQEFPANDENDNDEEKNRCTHT